MYTSKRCNDTSWARYSPVEASIIKSFLQLPQQSGLDGLEQALKFRLFAHINEQIIERAGDELVLTRSSHGEMPGSGNEKTQQAARLSLQIGGTRRISGICQRDRP